MTGKLSTHVWKLKDKGEAYDMNWEIVDRAPDCNQTNGKCRLCLKEKFYIIFQPEANKILCSDKLKGIKTFGIDLITFC